MPASTQTTNKQTPPWIFRACYSVLTFLALLCLVAGLFVAGALLSSTDALPGELPPCASSTTRDCYAPSCATPSPLDDCAIWELQPSAHHYEISVNDGPPIAVNAPPLRVTPSTWMPASRVASIRVRAVERDDTTGAELAGAYSNAATFDAVVACVSVTNCRNEPDGTGGLTRVCDGCERPCLDGAARFLQQLVACP